MVKRYLFVCGCARSGTSALVQLLNSHEAVSIGMERYISRFLTGRGLTPDLFTEERFFSVQKGDTFYDRLEFLKPVYDSLRPKWAQSSIIGDKIPKLYTRYAQIFSTFPEARVVFVSRNLIDVACSYKRRAEDQSDTAWSSRRDALKAIDDWNDANSKTLDAVRQYPKQVLVLSYESLFIRGEGLRELFEFIDLEPTAGVSKHFEVGLKRSSSLRASRGDSLSTDEKLAVCCRADTSVFRQLLDQVSVNKELPSSSLRALSPVPVVTVTQRPESGGPAIADSNGRSRPRAIIDSGKYQDADAAIVDYKYIQLPGTASLVRGPIPTDLSGGYVACLGGAHTLGRFIQQPYSSLLSPMVGSPVLNLGHGGGKPEFYLQSRGVLEVINRASCVVIQIMSARGSPNRYLKPTSHLHNIMSIAKGISSPKNPVFVDAAYRQLIKQLEAGKLREAVEETRRNWLAEMEKLMNRISVPKILFWFSVRSPQYTEGFQNLDALLGDYPQFVNAELVESLKSKAEAFVECVSRDGMPYTLRNAKTGDPVNVFPWQADPASNDYYPSAEMHLSAANVLAPVVGSLIQAKRSEPSYASN